MPRKTVASRSKKGKKESSSERGVLFGMSAALVVVLFITGCLIGIVLTRETKAEGTPQVIIDSVDLVRKSLDDDGSDTLLVDVYIDITNTGKVDVGTVVVKVTVEETDSSLALSLHKEMIKDLRSRTTKDVTITISLPKDEENYNIKIKLYVEDMLMVKGQSLVKMGLENKVTGSAFTTTEDRSQDYDGDDDDDDGGGMDFMSPEDDNAKGGAAMGIGFVGLIFMVIIIIISILIVLAIRHARNRGDEENNSTENPRENNDNSNSRTYHNDGPRDRF